MRHRILLIFTAGFALGVVCASNFTVSWIAFTIVAIVALISLCVVPRSAPIAFLATGVALGVLRLLACFPPGWDLATFVSPAPVTISAVVASEPKTSQASATMLVSTQQLVTRSGTFNVTGTATLLVHGAALRSVADIHIGDTIRASGELRAVMPATNPGEFDLRSYLRSKNVGGELVIQRPNGVVLVHRAPAFAAYLGWAASTRTALEAELGRSLPTDESALLFGILFGDRHGFSPDLQYQFAASGTSHILATAGLHVGILCLVLTALFRSTPLSRKVSAVLIVLLLWAFAAIAGGRPAVLRAVTAATIFFWGQLVERDPELPTTFSAAALAILVMQPAALFESDFQLSFVTVAGIALAMPFWQNFWRPRLRSVHPGVARALATGTVEIAGLSLIAQLSASLLILYYYNQFSTVSLPANLVVVPALFFLIPSAVLTVVVALLSPALGAFLATWLVHPELYFILRSISFFSHLPLSNIYVSSPPPWVIAAVYCASFAALIYCRPLKKRLLASQEAVT